MGGAILPFPQYAFMAWCLVKHRNNFTFSLRHRIQTGSGAQPASYPMGIGGSFPGGGTVEAWD
jgi:hypothetical protein